MSQTQPDAQTVEQRAQELLDVLQLQQIETNLYLGQNEKRRAPARLFGGQVLAQAARAAYATVVDVQLHSLHGYFLKAGDPTRPVLYEVERIRDGRSFTTRRVVAIQGGEAIFNLDASFQIDEPGFEHAHPMPNVPLPEELDDDVREALKMSPDSPNAGLLGPMARKIRPFELRSVFRPGSDAWAMDRFFNPVWIRFPLPVATQDIPLQRCLLAYASDMGMVSTASLPHQSDNTRDALQMASLDHAMWFHREFRADEWLLYVQDSPSASGARGFNRGLIFSQSGELVASTAQEGLVREHAA